MRARGFTLIEVLVVLALIGILFAVAYPSYAGYVTRTRRVEGLIALIERMQQEERYYNLHNRYLAFGRDADVPQEPGWPWWSGSSARASAYELRGRACDGATLEECIEIEATPGSANVDAGFRDPECGTLTLRSDGARSAGGTAPERCWP